MSLIDDLQRQNEELKRRLGDAEVALRKSEARYRILADNTTNWEFCIDPEGRFVSCTPSSEAITGHAAEEFLADPGLRARLIHPQDRARFDEHVRQVEHGRQVGGGEWRYVRADGTSHWVEHVCRPIFDDHGGYLGFRASNHDITEHKQAEAALREGEARLRFAQVSAGAGLWDWNIRTGRIEWSRELTQLFGLDPASTDSSFDVWRSALHPEDRADAERRIEDAVASRSPLASEYRIVLPSGEVRWISALGNTTYADDGTPQRMAGICIDITASKRTEELARQRLMEIEDLYRNAPVGLCVLDRDLRFVRINERLAEINGIPAAAHIGKQVRELMPELADAVEPEMRRVLETGQPRLNIEIAAETPARPGMQRTWLEQWLPVTDGRGQVKGLSIVVEETTERKRTETALREGEERLRLMIETSPVAVGFGDSAGTIFAANESFYRLTGYTREELKASQLGWDRLTAPEYAELDRQMMATLAATGSAGPYEKEYIRKDGSRIPLLLSVSKIAGRDEHVAFIVDITDRKLNEETLNSHRQLLETVISHMPAAVALIRGSDLRVQLVNPAYEAIAPGAHMLGKTLDELWSDTGRDFAAICRRVLDTGEPHHVVDELNTIRRQPGGPVERAYFSWSLHRVRLPGDEGWGLVNTTWETTARVTVEEALRQSQEDLSRAQEVGQIGWWRLDVRRDLLTWSDENHRIFGVPKGTRLDYEAFLATVHPDDREFVDAKWKAGLAGESYDIEHRIVAGGKVKWVREKAFLEHDRAGELLGGFGITQDITARRTAEEEVRRTEAERKVAEVVRAERRRLYDVLETLPAMICLLTEDHHVAFANKGFRDRFGDSKGRRCFEYCFGRSAPCEYCQTYDVLATGRPRTWEATTPAGTVIEVHDFPFTDADGTPMILEMDLDITERRRAEQALQDAHKDLAERAAQLRALAGELTLSEQRERRRLARVLHDHLQQLLVAAKYRTAALGQAGDEPSRAVAAEVERLLDTSISAARTLTAELSPPVLQESGLPAALAWLARWMTERHGLRVTMTIEEGLPPLAEDVRVLLFESVRELLFNAAKHAGAGLADVTVRRTTDENLRITVSDEGPGFDPATLGRGGDAARGFGLFSIRERLGLLGGSMEIDSAPGGSSRFTLTAPLALLADTRPPAAAAAPLPAGSEPAAKTGARRKGAFIRVLIVDDHPVVREGLRRLLGQEPDIQIAGEAADGQEAVAMAGTLHPDVVLMDVSMPKLDGVAATRAIHRGHPDIRIIGLSMFEDSGRADAMREAGAVDYLTKSGPPRDLLSAIRRAVRPPRARSGRAAARRGPRGRLPG